MSQSAEKTQPCYPLFEQDEYQTLFRNKRALEEAHDDESDARADGEPPGREAGRRRKLCRTDGRAAADEVML